MSIMRRSVPALALALAAASALALTGCSGAPAGSDGKPRLVASTNVYGDIASTIAGDAVDVTSILSNPAQDPHSYEPSAQDQLAISKADIVVENGAGYDAYAQTMVKAAPKRARQVLDVVDISGKKAVNGSLNEHVWYDFPTMQKFAGALVAALSKADPSHASTFRKNAAAFTAELAALEAKEAALKKQHSGTGVAVTEPVPLYMLDASGMVDKTPEAFSHAVEAGTDVSPEVLKQMLDLIGSGRVKVLAYNEQTTGPETERALAAAKAAGVPVLPVTETLPAGEHFADWMNANMNALAKAVG